MSKRTEEQKAARRTPEERAKANAYAKQYRQRPHVRTKILEDNRSRYKERGEQYREANRQRYKTDPIKREKHREENRRRLYGITSKEYQALWTKQQGKCAVCTCIPTGKRKLAVDHDHISGQIRGLLCVQCNAALGLLHEDVHSIMELARYIINAKGT